MIWLDQILAVPTIGCTFKPSFDSSQDYLAALRPLLKRWAEKVDFRIDAPKPLELVIETGAGYTYSFGTNSIVAQFRYAFELKDKPGQIPDLLYKTDVQKYTALLESTMEELCQVFDQIVGSGTKSLIKVGIVASCRLDGEALPPGVVALARHLARPWGTELLKCQTHLLAVLTKNERAREQCHHHLNIEEERKQDVRLTLDWQRVVFAPPEIRRGKLRDQVKECTDAALKYFDHFATGELHYALND